MYDIRKAFASFSVNDLTKAKDFYGKILRVELTEVPEMKNLLILHFADNNRVMLYQKADHIPAAFTVLNFPVEDVEKKVDELTGKGVKFEKYEGELKTDEKGILSGGGPKIAWFKDPSGNILSVVEEK